MSPSPPASKSPLLAASKRSPSPSPSRSGAPCTRTNGSPKTKPASSRLPPSRTRLRAGLSYLLVFTAAVAAMHLTLRLARSCHGILDAVSRINEHGHGHGGGEGGDALDGLAAIFGPGVDVGEKVDAALKAAAPPPQPMAGDESSKKPPQPGGPRFRPPSCPPVEAYADVLLILLVSGTTPGSALTQYLRTNRCVPASAIAIYSDAPGTARHPDGGPALQVIDALAAANLSAALVPPPAEFALHDAVRQHRAHGMSAAGLSAHKNFAALQKWRVLPALLDAHRAQPRGKRWFVVAEPRVHIGWHNLLLWTGATDGAAPRTGEGFPAEAVYRGAQMALDGRGYAALDAGILVSRGAVARLARRAVMPVLRGERGDGRMSREELVRSRLFGTDRPLEGAGPIGRKRPRRYLRKWYDDIGQSCCADVALSTALADVGVNLTHSWPLMQSANMLEMEWKEENVCSAAVSWGKVDEWQAKLLADAEVRVMQAKLAASGAIEAREEPIRYRDIFVQTLLPRMLQSPNISAWDNLSNDHEYYDGKSDGHHAANPYNSPDACLGACGLWPECVQWRWEPGKCRLAKNLRMGVPVVGAEEMIRHEWNGLRQGVVSGWIGSRVEQLVQSWNCEMTSGFAFS